MADSKATMMCEMLRGRSSLQVVACVCAQVYVRVFVCVCSCVCVCVCFGKGCKQYVKNSLHKERKKARALRGGGRSEGRRGARRTYTFARLANVARLQAGEGGVGAAVCVCFLELLRARVYRKVELPIGRCFGPFVRNAGLESGLGAHWHLVAVESEVHAPPAL